MKDVFVTGLKNVTKFHSCIDRINHNLTGVERMALVFSDPGYGKTRTALHYAVNNGAIMIRTKKLMTGRWLLEEIVEELGAEPKWKGKDLFAQAVDMLGERRRTIILDEIDYLARDSLVIETMRDLHDIAHCPMMFIGMGQADRKLMRYPHVYDRFVQVIKFEKLDKEDVHHMVEELSEIRFEEDAIERISADSQGRIREIIKMIHRAEAAARANRIKIIGAKDFR
jgi:DNA transposition AAA+ family ATPase